MRLAGGIGHRLSSPLRTRYGWDPWNRLIRLAGQPIVVLSSNPWLNKASRMLTLLLRPAPPPESPPRQYRPRGSRLGHTVPAPGATIYSGRATRGSDRPDRSHGSFPLRTAGPACTLTDILCAMTTRQSLHRRRWQAALLIFALMLIVGVHQSAQPTGFVLKSLLTALLLSAMVCSVWNVCQTRCLNCQTPLGWIALSWVLHPVEIADVSPHCPHCDVSIDRDFPTSR